jgi:tight adherence protein B
MVALGALLVFLAFALAGHAIAAWLGHREAARRQVAQRLDVMAGKGRVQLSGSLLRDQRLSRIGLLNALLGRTPLVLSIARTIRQAGLKRRAGEVLLYIPLLASTALLINQLAGGPLMAGVIVGLAAGSLPLIIVARIRRKRTQRFSEQLPEALDLIRSGLQAGHGLPGALAVAADTFPDPLSHELRYAIEEMRVGLSLREALCHLADRVPDPNLPILTVGILVAHDSGGNLAEVVGNLAHTIRERFKLHREVKVLTAQGRLSGMILTVLPFLVGATMYFLNPIYFAPMIAAPAGHWMLAYALVSVLLGHLLIRRLVTPKA